ncbi:MAG: hypothetical protein K2G91_04500 [Prevotella sp.]|nr:hypothetical protein [Prevotella sp.]
MNIKKTSLRLTTIGLLAFLAISQAMAQETTTMATLYSQFKPAVITLTDGRTITNSLTNVFLKNSSLLYMNNTYTMEANMANIRQVTFDDNSFVVVKNQLASVVDSAGSSVLYRIDYLDIEAYNAQLKNNIQLSHLSMTDFVNTDAVDLTSEEDRKFPLVHKYYMLYKGELVLVHEREILRRLSKEKKRIFHTIISQPNFSWLNDASVVQLMKSITE